MYQDCGNSGKSKLKSTFYVKTSQNVTIMNNDLLMHHLLFLQPGEREKQSLK